MEELGMRSSPRLEDIPELIHRIQSLLPVKEAARTSVLSKSWLHAWSTIPNLRFRESAKSLSKKQKLKHLQVVNRSLIRYVRDNIPIESIDLMIDIVDNNESASLADNWIQSVATRSCLKELSLFIVLLQYTGSFTLPIEILSCKTLIKIRIQGRTSWNSDSLLMITPPVINCVFLRELQLEYVHISDEAVHDILSTCKLLVKIELSRCNGFNTIKIKNLPCLYKLRIDAYQPNVVLETYNVPNLRLFRYDVDCEMFRGRNSLLINYYTLSLGSVTKLWLGGMIMDDAFLDIIESKLPLLESLTLHMRSCILESFEFTCASMKRLSLLSCRQRLNNVQVNAPKLLFFYFNGSKMPSLLFPAAISLLMQIKILLSLRYRVNDYFFLNMREALTLSRKCYIKIEVMDYNIIWSPSEVDIDDLRRRVALDFPAVKVRQILFQTISDQVLCEGLPFFDALFFICDPKHVVAKPYEWFRNKHNVWKLIVTR